MPCQIFHKSRLTEFISAMAAGWNLQLIVETWSQGGLIATRVGLAAAKSHTCERHACVVSNKQARLKYAERMGQGGRDNMHISWWGNTNLNSRVSYGEALWRKVLRGVLFVRRFFLWGRDLT